MHSSAGYSVENEEGFARVYDEDETVTIRKGDLRALLDVATGSMDFGSGFLDNEQVEVLRRIAPALGIDAGAVTPTNFHCAYDGKHRYHKRYIPATGRYDDDVYVCLDCRQLKETP